MDLASALPLELVADATAASEAMRAYITPVIATIIGVASIAVVFFLVIGGIQYMTSAGDPEKLAHAKKILRNALIGLVMVIAAGTLTAILHHAYNGATGNIAEKFPALTTIEPESGGVTEVLLSAIIGVLKNIIQAIGKPIIDALSFFTSATPLMADNSGVFNLWLAIVGIVDVLFILVVALLGFHVMSFATFGFEEMEFKQLLPRLALAFLLINTSIFAVDAIVSLSNGMIAALQAGFATQTVWDVLKSIVDQQGGLGLSGLLLMIVFVILSAMLLVYYMLRLVVLYIGAVLAPVVFLVWLLPPFKDFAETAMKTYIMVIFVLFIHVVILQLASSIFGGLLIASPEQALNPIMSMFVGIATLLALLKTQSALSQMSFASLGPKTAARLGSKLTNAISHYGGKKLRSLNQTRQAAKQPPSLRRESSGVTPHGPSKTVISSVHRKSKSSTANNQSNVSYNNVSSTRIEGAPPPTGRTQLAPKVRKAKEK